MGSEGILAGPSSPLRRAQNRTSSSPHGGWLRECGVRKRGGMLGNIAVWEHVTNQAGVGG